MKPLTVIQVRSSDQRAATATKATRPKDSFGEAGVALLLALAIASPILGVGGRMIHVAWCEERDALQAAIFNAQAYERLVGAPAAPVVPVPEAAHGRDLFVSSCASCHGVDAKGVEFMGKDLVASDFVARTDDAELSQFITEGRVAKPLSMPPKGGHDELADEDLAHIVVYLRGVQDPRRMPELPALVVTGPSEAQKQAALEAAGGDVELAEYIASGDKQFHSTCVACHGKAGVGIKGNGAALKQNAFVGSLSDDDLLAFIKRGRSPSDPKSTTGIQMPPKGGNPALSDDDLLDIISYLRTLQPKDAGVNAGG